jgi:hypothetical protein
MVKILELIVGHTPSYEFLVNSKEISFMLVFIHRKLWQNRLNYSGSSALMTAVQLQSA